MIFNSAGTTTQAIGASPIINNISQMLILVSIQLFYYLVLLEVALSSVEALVPQSRQLPFSHDYETENPYTESLANISHFQEHALYVASTYKRAICPY